MNCCNIYELPLTQLLLGNSFHPGGLSLTRQLANLAMVGPGTKMLDLACGKGESARLFASEYAAQVTGLDQSAALLAQAQQQTDDAGLTDLVQYVLFDSSRLPFADNCYDVVLCECALCLFPNGQLILSEAMRVLKPGGRLALSDVVINKPVPPSLQGQLATSLCIAGAWSLKHYQEMLNETGFVNIRIRDVSEVLLKMVAQIEKRMQFVEVTTELKKLESQSELAGLSDTITRAKEFIYNQGIGYSLLTARKPARPYF